MPPQDQAADGKLTPKQVLTDPEFLGMPPERRMLILERIDPEFARMSPTAQQAVVGYKAPTTGAATQGPSSPPATFEEWFPGWAAQNAASFGKTLAGMPAAMWHRSWGQFFNPADRAAAVERQAEEKRIMQQPGIMPGLSYTAQLANPVVRRGPDGEIDYGATTANLMPYLLSAGRSRAVRSPLGLAGETTTVAGAPSFTAEEAARRVTRALNPKGADIPGYQEQLAQHLDKVMDYARTKKLPMRTPEDLANAIKGAGDKLHDYFYRSILGPKGETQVSVGGIPEYQGTAEGGSTTLTNLDKRLAEINAELDPAYRKAAADSGRKLRTETDLRAEQGAIQERYYRALSEATLIPAEQLRAMRQAFGSLDDLATKTRLRAGDIQHAAVAREQMPRYYIPFMRGHMGEPFFINEWARQGIEKVAGTPPERGIRTALGGRETPTGAEPYRVPGAANLPERVSEREPPVRGGPGEPVGTVETPSEGERAANRLRLAERRQQVLEARRAAQARAQARALRKTGGPGEPAGTVETPTAAERQANVEKLAERGREVQRTRSERTRGQLKPTRKPVYEMTPQERQQLRQLIEERIRGGG